MTIHAEVLRDIRQSLPKIPGHKWYPYRVDEQARTMTLLCPRCFAELVTYNADDPPKRLPKQWWVCGCEKGLQA